EVRALAGRDDYAARHAIAWLRWSRYRALPSGEDDADLAAAVGLFARLFAEDPAGVPDLLRQLFGDPDDADPAVVARGADTAMTQAVAHGDWPAAGEAIRRRAAALAAMPVDHPDRAGLAHSLG